MLSDDLAGIALEPRDVVLVSIRHPHVDHILAGTKTVELRKPSFTAAPRLLVIYATAPTSRIVAIASIRQIHRLPLSLLWRRCGPKAAIAHDLFRRYFANSASGVGLEIGRLWPLAEGYSLSALRPGLRAPQGLVYLTPTEVTRLFSAAARPRRRRAIRSPGRAA